MKRTRWKDLLRRSRRRADEARREMDAGGGGPPAPGDLFVLPETAELPVEWAILDRDPGPPERFLAVPADANPLAGSADVEVPAGEPGGPLTLRCRYGVWIDAEALIPQRRTGVLAPAAVAEARRKWRELKRGEPSASSLAWEVDADPEYQDWLADTAEPARAAVEEARRRASKRPANGRVLPFPGSGIHLLAAALSIACIGLAVWVAVLARTVDRLNEPVFAAPAGEVELGGDSRGLPEETAVRVPRGASRFLVVFVFDRHIEAGTGRFEIRAPDGEILARSGPRRIEPYGELMLILPRRSFPDGRYRVRLLEEAGGPPLDEAVLIVETAEEQEVDSSASPPRVPE